MRRRRSGMILVSAEQLAEKLGLWDARVTHVERDATIPDLFRVVVEGPTMPLVAPGMPLEAVFLDKLKDFEVNQ